MGGYKKINKLIMEILKYTEDWKIDIIQHKVLQQSQVLSEESTFLSLLIRRNLMDE